MLYHCDVEYCRLLYDLQKEGEHIHTRNGDVRRLIGRTIVFQSLPLISLRRTAWRNSIREFEWFMSGSNRISELHPSVQDWWKPWGDKDGFVAHNYSRQFRNFYGCNDGVDQIDLLLKGVKHHPYSRRNLITTWNTADMNDEHCKITNCHSTVTQVFVQPDNTLDLVMYQRSVDVVCGLPHNLVQYWSFMLWLAHHGGRKPGRFIWIGGDIHLYKQHYELADRITGAYPLLQKNGPLTLVYTPTGEDFKADDFTLTGEYSPVITERAEMIV